MYTLAFALLFIASAQTAVAAKLVNFEKARPGRDVYASRKALATSNASASRMRNRTRSPASKERGRKHGAQLASAASRGVAGGARSTRPPARVTFPSGASLPVVKGSDRAGQEYHDPNRSGIPLLNTSGAHRLKMLSDNFSVAEIARSGGKTFGAARIDPRQVTCLQRIRNHVGSPVLIRSGYRSFSHNIEVYRRLGKRPTKSQHLSGRAADIKIEGMTGLEIAKAAIDACGPDVAVGLGPAYAHIDVRGDSSVWKYEGVTNRQVAEVERYRMARRMALKGRPRRQRRGSPLKRGYN